MTDDMRVQKYLSRAGRASRREAERMMVAGRVRVNGEVVRELGSRLDPERDTVEVDGRPVRISAPRWLALHKPAGVLTTRRDPGGGRTVYDVLPFESGDLRYVGRLDRDTEGLLLLTNQGDALHALTHPSYEVEREYRATVRGVPGEDVLRRLVEGVRLDDGPARALVAELVDLERGNGVVRLVLAEGRKREVRRMLDATGYPALRLVRTRYGPVELGDLRPGAWRGLTEAELEGIARIAGTG